MKRIVLSFAVLLTSVCVHADPQILRWCVYQDDDPVAFDIALISVLEGDVRVGYLRTPGREEFIDTYAPTSGEVAPYDVKEANSSILADWQGAAYSFQLELMNENNENYEIVLYGTIVSYEELKNTAIYDYGDATPYKWNALGPAPVPEPTGGVLVLLGAALLGLRRKKAVA